MLGDLPLFKSRYRYWNSSPPWHSIARLTFSVTFSGSRVNPTCTGSNHSLDSSVWHAFYSRPVGVHLAEHHSKVGPAISSCPRIEGGEGGGWYRSQLCSAIRLQQETPRCPAGDRYNEEHSDSTGPAGNSFIRPTGNYFEHFLSACFNQPAQINTPLSFLLIRMVILLVCSKT